jgi:hypothetical protein
MPFQQGLPGAGHVPDAIDDLIASAQANAIPTPHQAAAETKAAAPEKKGKEKNVRLVYSDNEVSPEEKMAANPRYAFALKA